MRVPQEICVSVPGSKSITNRALLIAALADGTTTLHNVLFSDDSRHFIQALQTLGFDCYLIGMLGGNIVSLKMECSILIGWT